MLHTGKPNRLINSTSPYLLQHAFNPVDWYEWGEEALIKAKRENKPILVSIGYSSCHWCHVMEREVFEKEEMAAKMNAYLVCIKVDREERPDIDQIYMDAVQAMGQHGGWPLNVFLTPDQKPFYGGTYFPPEQWMNVIGRIHQVFTNQRDQVEESAEQFAQHLSHQDTSKYFQQPTAVDFESSLNEVFKKLEISFDKVWGGLEKEPKFIMPSIWLWLLRFHRLSQNPDALQQTVTTLKRVAMGGIYDQIGGGFARYSADGYWFAPHFEKMLYDNAQLLSLYAEAYAVTKDDEFLTILNETYAWLMTEMLHPDGGFYSALDADSEGIEGKFYTWTKREIDNILADDAPLVNTYYSIKEEGNWEHGANILFRAIPEEKFLEKSGLEKKSWQTRLSVLKDRLLEIRDKRIKPGLDDKIITGWNAMMIVGLTDAYRYTGIEKFLSAAVRNMEFLERHLTEGTTLYRSFKGKRSNTLGFLDDYAFVIQALIRLYQVTFNEYWIKRAEIFMTHTIDHFFDSTDGFFHYAGKYSEKLIAQKKEIFDNVIPASNSVMAQNLLDLSFVLDNDWRKMGQHMIDSLTHIILSEPNYMSNWAIAYTQLKKGTAEVTFIGPENETMRTEFLRSYEPFAFPMGAPISSDLPLLKDKKALNSATTVYVCFDRTCKRPVHKVNEALEQLK